MSFVSTAPDFLRYFVRDAIEGVIAFAGTLVIASLLDPSLNDPAATPHAIILGVAVALVAAARRNKDRFVAFVNKVLNTEPGA